MSLKKFCEQYLIELTKAKERYPDEYAWADGVTVKVVHERMCLALEKGTYNKEGRAIRNTCRALGIRQTYKQINDYLARDNESEPLPVHI